MKLEPITRANRPGRKEVLMREDEAAALIKDGSIVIVGGFGTVNHPMPIVRALIRRKIRNLTVIGAATARAPAGTNRRPRRSAYPVASIDVDRPE